MSAYDKLAYIDAEIRAGRTTLVDVLDFLRIHRVDRFNREQYVTATKVNAQPAEPEPEPEPEKPRPEPIKRRRQRIRA